MEHKIGNKGLLLYVTGEIKSIIWISSRSSLSFVLVQGPKGSSFFAGCHLFTCMERKDMIMCVNKKKNMFTSCRRTGNRFYWKKELAEQKCCMFENKVKLH